ncbi:MAG: metal ABC transporter ATP-binding protein [Marinifilaceae bacterium]
MQRKLVELVNIEAAYDSKTVLSGVNLTIQSGDFLGVIGPNGGGKTTLLRIVLGLLKPQKGKVHYYDERENLFGYLPQRNDFDAAFPITVEEVVLSGLFAQRNWWNFSRKKDREAVHELLKKYDLMHYANTPIGALSGGEMQRVLLCRAIISSPKVLILDEPTTYVDSNFETEFYSLIQELNKTMAIIMVSHDLGTICSYVKTIACVNKHLHYHNSNLITDEQLKSYNCPLEIIAHGTIPHRVLLIHDETQLN